MLFLVSHLRKVFFQELVDTSSTSASARFGAAIRAIALLTEHRQLFELELFKRYVVAVKQGDALFHLSHRHFLTTKLTSRQRVRCVQMHYRYDGDSHDESYHHAVYAGTGVILWSNEVEGTHYEIRLVAASDTNWEGIIDVCLFAGTTVLCTMSFSWMNSSMFESKLGVVPFITRNQSLRRSATQLQEFRHHYPQNFPPYFCLAALQGIAIAHGCPALFGVQHDSQVAFSQRNERSFKNSYTNLWRTFGGTEVGGQAYAMPVPFNLLQLQAVGSKHRCRASARRSYWGDITDSAVQVINRHHSQHARSVMPGIGLAPRVIHSSKT